MGALYLQGRCAQNTWWIADDANHRVRRVFNSMITSENARVCRTTWRHTPTLALAWCAAVVGTGTGGYSPDGSVGTFTMLSFPNAVAWSAARGRLLLADTGNCLVRMYDPTTQLVTTLAGNRTCGHTGDGGLATAAAIDSPRGLSVDAAGNTFVTFDAANVVRTVALNGTITTVLGWPYVAGVPFMLQAASGARLNAPRTAVPDAYGHLW